MVELIQAPGNGVGGDVAAGFAVGRRQVGAGNDLSERNLLQAGKTVAYAIKV